MKRKPIIFAAALLIACSVSFQSCIGSFALTNKVLTWNKNVSNKFLNEVVFFAFWVLPVYEVTAVADLLVINSIEFWSGNVPLEANNKVIPTEHGDYRILAHETGYDVIGPDGQTTYFRFDTDTQTWSFSKNEQEAIDFLKFTGENSVMILDASGEFVDVELTPEGVTGYMRELGYPMMASNY